MTASTKTDTLCVSNLNSIYLLGSNETFKYNIYSFLGYSNQILLFIKIDHLIITKIHIGGFHDIHLRARKSLNWQKGFAYI